ncbi:MAG: hypothetical protein PHU51_00270 [Candidatus Nanoarchaeia archaeon]|nr:hypothetical protein [Candidatus Nanoarchaeia archaeon]
MRQVFILFISFIFILLVSSLTVSYYLPNEFDDYYERNLTFPDHLTISKPEFILKFDSSDQPVTLINSPLLYSTTSFAGELYKSYNLNQTITSSNMTFFPVDSQGNKIHLFNGYYVLEVPAQDGDGNTQLIKVNAVLNATQPWIKVVEPLNPFASRLVYQNYVPYNVTFQTEIPAVCKIGYLSNGNEYQNNLYSYNQLTTQFLTESDNKHKIIATNLVPQSQNELQIYSSDELGMRKYVVGCKASEGDNDYFFAEEFAIGYDLTPASIEVNIDPLKIIDPKQISTSLNIISSDPVICNYSFVQNPNQDGFPSYTPTSDWITEDTSVTEAYVKNLNFLFNFMSEPNYYGVTNFFNQDPLTYSLKLNCLNLPGIVTTKDVSFELLLNKTISVIQKTKYFNTNTQNHEFTSNILSEMSYCLKNQSNDFCNLTSIPTDKTEHTLTTSKTEEGTYYIGTEFSATTGISLYTFEYIVDKTLPSPVEATSSLFACTDKEISSLTLSVESNSTDVKYYNFTLVNSTNNIIYAQQSPSNSATKSGLKAPIGSTFKWTVFPIDYAGNKGTEKVFNILVVQSTDTRCDIQKPQGKVNLSLATTGIKATLTCTDNVGCATDFKYGFGSFGSCKPEDYETNTAAYSTQNIIVNQTKTLCFKFSDLNNNYNTLSKIVTYVPHCFNKIKDSDEEGIDCGGSCAYISVCGQTPNAEGENCTVNSDCFSDLVCHQSICTDPEDLKKAEGEDCVRDSDCKSSLKCVDDICSSNFISCDTDADCATNEECNYYGECVLKSEFESEEEPVYEDYGSSSILAIILIILGLISIGGGSYFIYYWRNNKAEEEIQNQRMQQQAEQERQQQLSLMSAEERRKKLAELKKRKEEGEKKRGKIVEDRLKSRKGLLDAFNVEDEVPETEISSKTDELGDQDISLDADDLARKARLKNHGKLDEGMDEEYLDLSEYSGVDDDPFTHLRNLSSSSTKKPIPKKAIKVPHLEEKPQSTPKNDTFSKLAQLNQSLDLKSLQERLKGKTLINSKNPSLKKLDVDSFVEEVYNNAVKNNPNKNKTINLEVSNLKTLFKMLQDDGKLDPLTKNDIIYKLLQKGLIKEEQIHHL